MDDEDPKEKKRRYQREWKKKRYDNDPDFREKVLAECRAFKKVNREKWNAYVRGRYASDSEFRAKASLREAKHRHAHTCRRHGISVAEFDAMFTRQHGAC